MEAAMSMNPDLDPLYVKARQALLDALEALGDHHNAVVLVGAQAIYLHVGEADLAVSPFTTDGDLAIDPRTIGDIPPLLESLQAAGFSLHRIPGSWKSTSDVEIDLMVPEQLAGPGRRGADLGVHGREAARRAKGLEATLVDCSPMELSALDPQDERKVMIKVAGPTALLIAKLHKIGERVEAGNLNRVKPKDALDVLRLLRGIQSEVFAGVFRQLSTDPLAEQVTIEALSLLRDLFGTPEASGSQLAAAAAYPLEDEDLIKGSCAAIATEVLGLVEVGQ
jgi:hypothetical protein